MKDSGFSEFDILPVLTIDNLSLCGTQPILAYVARKFGYYPEYSFDEYLIDSTCEVIFYITRIFDDLISEEELEKISRFCQEQLPNFLGKLERRLNDNNEGSG